MADTTFTDGVTLTAAAWFQDLNNVYYRLTANRVPYGTGTALTSSANLTFDGTTLTSATGVFTGTMTANGITSTANLAVQGNIIVGNTAGTLRLSQGVRIGADSTDNLLDDASTGAASATLYIGNASINVTSDENLKYNIQPFKSGLDLVMQLEPIEYDQDELRPFGHIGHYVGFGARAVHKVAPWAVHTQGDSGLPWQARYEFLMAPVVGAVQELASRLSALEAAR